MSGEHKCKTLPGDKVGMFEPQKESEGVCGRVSAQWVVRDELRVRRGAVMWTLAGYDKEIRYFQSVLRSRRMACLFYIYKDCGKSTW